MYIIIGIIVIFIIFLILKEIFLAIGKGLLKLAIPVAGVVGMCFLADKYGWIVILKYGGIAVGAIIAITIVISVIKALSDSDEGKVFLGFVAVIAVIAGIAYVLSRYLGWKKVLIGIGIVVAVLIAVCIIIGIVDYWIRTEPKRNERKLNKYLNRRCRFCGLMTTSMWRSRLPKFAYKTYETDFDKIVTDFTRVSEEIFLDGVFSDYWWDELIKLIYDTGGRNGKQLKKACPIRNTHCTDDTELIYRVIEKTIDEKRKYNGKLVDIKTNKGNPKEALYAFDSTIETKTVPRNSL